ncbi:MAG TPA: glycosyltransferase family 39 protein, partial [Thermoanaerobaculia bacterium]|nr:glycosyltransferase family 39 protein [Thermoanaerobaculia bacterium]
LVAAATGHVPFRALIVLSAITAVAGFILLALAFRHLAGSTRAGVLGALLFYASPTMLLHATLPQSDSGALALLALAIWFCARAMDDEKWVPYAALACAATVGWRLQFAIAVVPLFLVSVLLLRAWRARFVAAQWFAIGCAAWLIALITACGGVDGFWTMMSGQAQYFAAHDADLSRTGRSAAQIALRFVSHPWGPKWLAAPLLALAVLGAVDAVRRRLRIVLPVIAMSVVYLGFALAMMDPADGVRYALPALPGIALLAVLGVELLRRLSRELLADWALVALYIFGAYAYTAPLLRQRTTQPSPPYAAIQYLRSVAPRNAVILYDLPLKPHAQYLLRGYTRMRVDEGLLRFGHRVDRPLYELTDSATAAPQGKVFRWETPDAYTKLTRGHYGAASVVPLPVTQRFLALGGISPPERTGTGSWRWIGAKGVIALPDLGARGVRLTLEVPNDYPLPSNRVRVDVAGGGSVSGVVTRGAKTVLDVPLPAGRAELTITPERTFVPADVPGRLSRDRRTLSVMLTGLEQLTAASAPRSATPVPAPPAAARRSAS